MAANEVIDWDEAMEQCGDDEEFLRELLADLRGEIDLQVQRIDEILRRVSFLSYVFVWTANMAGMSSGIRLMPFTTRYQTALP